MTTLPSSVSATAPDGSPDGRDGSRSATADGAATDGAATDGAASDGACASLVVGASASTGGRLSLRMLASHARLSSESWACSGERRRPASYALSRRCARLKARRTAGRTRTGSIGAGFGSSLASSQASTSMDRGGKDQGRSRHEVGDSRAGESGVRERLGVGGGTP